MINISIVIPLRIDSLEREANLQCVLQHLLRIECVYIELLEADVKRRFFFPTNNRIRYRFIYDEEPVFYRTRYLNLLLRNARYPIVGVWDADVIIPEKQLLQAINIVYKGYVMCFPYDGDFRFLNAEESKAVRNDMEILGKNQGARLLGRPSVGGAFVVNRDQYLAVGGENEGFYGWGPEDAERVKRMEILELPVARVNGSLYHLYHRQTPDVGINDEKRRQYNQKVLLHICRMDRLELSKYIEKYMLR